jgi:hypothetical protein
MAVASAFSRCLSILQSRVLVLGQYSASEVRPTSKKKKARRAEATPG